MTIETKDDIENLKIIGKIVADTLKLMINAAKVGGSHGVGRALHEEPGFIANYYDPDDKRVLHEGQVITIEPFLSTKSSWVEEASDGWTLYAEIGNIAAQYEHTMIITKHKPIIVTA
jgi:methionyl aminopeptidase